MSDLENTTSTLTKKQQYFKDYYQQHSDVVGKYSVNKYAKNKYRLTDQDCDLYGEHVCLYGKFLKLKEQLQKQFPDQAF